ncbi:MAG: energy transducer TonB [Planctomycetota bacterium]|jgi:protein TonB
MANERTGPTPGDEPAQIVYRPPASPLAPRLRAVALSVVFAAATFAVLPLFGLLSASVHESAEVREAPDIVLHTPPAPRLRMEAKPEERPPSRPKLRKRPELEKQRLETLPDALLTRLSLSMSSLEAGAGDFSLEFAVGPEELAAPENDRPPVFDLAEVDRRPRPTVRMKPLYPMRARERGIEGIVRLRFVVGADGSVRDVEVVSSEPEGVFDRAAKAAAARWRFAPAVKDGQPVAARVRTAVRFRLEDR